MLRKASDLQGDYLSEIKGTSVYGVDDEKLGSVNDALVDDGSYHYARITLG